MNWEIKNIVADKFPNYVERNITKVLFQKEEIQNIELKFQTIREVEFHNCLFTNVIFNNLFLAKVRFIACEFINTNIIESVINQVEFQDCKFTNVSIFETKITNLLINEGIMQYSKWENTQIDKGKFEGLISKSNIYRKNKFYNIEFFKVEFKEDNFIDTKFKNNDFRTSHFRETNIDVDALVSCRVSFLNMIEILSTKGIILED